MAVSALGVSLICSQICVEGRHFSFLLCNIYPLGLSPVLGWREFALEFPHMCMWEENVYPLTFGGRTKIHPLSLTCGEILPTLDMFSNAWEEKISLLPHRSCCMYVNTTCNLGNTYISPCYLGNRLCLPP